MGRDKEGEVYLIKCNISRDDDAVYGEIKIVVALMISKVS
jgi:hypothetical protein